MSSNGEAGISLKVSDPGSLQHLVDEVFVLLNSRELMERQRGYELFDEIVKQCLYQSCINYRGLLDSHSDPIKAILMRAIEAWANASTGRALKVIADSNAADMRTEWENRHMDEERDMKNARKAARSREALLDEIGEESFPASDPPAGTVQRIGAPCSCRREPIAERDRT